MLRVVRDVGDELVVDTQRPDAAQAPYAAVLRAVAARWPDLDPARQVLIEPGTCARIKNDARVRQLIARTASAPKAPEQEPEQAQAEGVRLDGVPAVFLFDVRLLNPLYAVQPSPAQVIRCLPAAPHTPRCHGKTQT